MLLAVLIGVVALAAIVMSKSNSDDAAPAATPTTSESASATPTESASASATAEATDATAADATGEAPSRFIGNWKDSSHAVLVLTWKAPAAAVTGYLVETASNGGAFKEASRLPATQLSLEVTKGDTAGYTSFRVSALYEDGSIGQAKAFGFAGQFA